MADMVHRASRHGAQRPEAEFGPPFLPHRSDDGSESADGLAWDKDDTLGFIERAVHQLATSDDPRAALRELDAFLIDALSLTERDPGLELAAEDLHSAAALIAAERLSGSQGFDKRRWRLLVDGARRFRSRLERIETTGRPQT